MEPKTTNEGNEAIIEEFMWQMKGDQHNICGEYVPAFCDKQEKRLRTLLTEKDKEIEAAEKAMFDKGWNDGYSEGKEEAVDAVARAIYQEMSYTEDGIKPEWVVGGNSLKQNEARRKAREALALLIN